MTPVGLKAEFEQAWRRQREKRSREHLDSHKEAGKKRSHESKQKAKLQGRRPNAMQSKAKSSAKPRGLAARRVPAKLESRPGFANGPPKLRK